MNKGSANYKKLSLRLAALRRNLLNFMPDPAVSKVVYSDSEFDLTRAYVVLVHAAIEEYCEELAREKVKKAKQVYDSVSTIKPVLRWIITYHVVKNHGSWNVARNPLKEQVEEAYNFYIGLINSNNGVKRKDIEKLLFPLGINDQHLYKFSTWLAQMNSFGVDRGNFAHKGIGTSRPPDPLTQLTTINQLLVGLLDLDRLVGGR